VGPNGAGKTTLLNMLTGRLEADSGTREVGQTTAFGYYTQHELTYSDDQRVIDVVREVAEVITMADGSEITAGQLLLQFQFSGPQQYTFVSKLSGGQKRRLQLLRVLMANPNFLILDEPTNDLDIPTLNVLEDFLLGFPGCLVIVSHDRYFMDRLVEQILVFEGHEGEIRSFPGNYTDFRQAEKDAARESLTPSPSPKGEGRPAEKGEKASTKHVIAPIVAAAETPKKRTSPAAPSPTTCGCGRWRRRSKASAVSLKPKNCAGWSWRRWCRFSAQSFSGVSQSYTEPFGKKLYETLCDSVLKKRYPIGPLPNPNVNPTLRGGWFIC
jgi:ABC-type multidrug transport system ATPase subunit